MLCVHAAGVGWVSVIRGRFQNPQCPSTQLWSFGDPRSSTSSASRCSELRWADKDTKCFTAAHYRCLRKQSGLPGVRKVSGRVTPSR